MLIGSPKEIKNHEYRVGLTPESVKELVMQGHEVWIETEAGCGIDATDEQYVAAGAKIVDGPDPIFAECEMVVKVKEPQAVERKKLREGQILYTYLHLAPDPDQTKDLLDSGVTAIAYETVTGPRGQLPLLKPMSQVAGRMSVQAGATALEKAHGGRGVLLGGVPGVMPGKVVVIGGGVVGFNAAQMAVGLGADVTILDRDPEVLEKVGTHFEARASTRFSNAANLYDAVTTADLVIGAVLIPGAAGRCRDRPRGLFRNQPCNHSCRSDICRGRRGSLLRREYARGRCPHQHLCAEQCHPAACATHRPDGVERRARRRPASCRRSQRPQGRSHVRGRRKRTRL